MPQKLDTVIFNQPFYPSWEPTHPRQYTQQVWDEIAGFPKVFSFPDEFLDKPLPLTIHIAPDSWSAIQDGKGHPEFGPALLTLQRASPGASEVPAPVGTPIYQYLIEMPSYFEVPRKESFLGGFGGSLIGGVAGAVLAPFTGGSSLVLAGIGASLGNAGQSFAEGNPLGGALSLAGGALGIGGATGIVSAGVSQAASGVLGTAGKAFQSTPSALRPVASTSRTPALYGSALQSASVGSLDSIEAEPRNVLFDKNATTNQGVTGLQFVMFGGVVLLAAAYLIRGR